MLAVPLNHYAVSARAWPILGHAVRPLSITTNNQGIGEKLMAMIDVKTEITGNVWKVEINEGDTVTEGQVLVILESMKMEIPILSPEDGVIKELRVKEGDVTTEGDVVAIVEA